MLISCLDIITPFRRNHFSFIFYQSHRIFLLPFHFVLFFWIPTLSPKSLFFLQHHQPDHQNEQIWVITITTQISSCTIYVYDYLGVCKQWTHISEPVHNETGGHSHHSHCHNNHHDDHHYPQLVNIINSSSSACWSSSL